MVRVDLESIPVGIKPIISSIEAEFGSDSESLFVVESKGMGMDKSNDSKVSITMYYPKDNSTFASSSTRLAAISKIVEEGIEDSDNLRNDTYAHSGGVDGSKFPEYVPDAATEKSSISIHLQ